MANRTWNPSLPGGVPRDTPLDTSPSETGLPWDRAPSDSHLWGFRFYDARKYSFLRRFGPSDLRGKSQLQVRFKDPKTGQPKSEYVYYFDNHDQGRAYFERMKAHSSPGEVVQELIAAAIPYRKQGHFS
jgi:hypothetical protein